MKHAIILFAAAWWFGLAGAPTLADESIKTPAFVFKACGPGDSWYRFVLLVPSPQGEVARVEFEEGRMKALTAGERLAFATGDDEPLGQAFKHGAALFPCARDQSCRAAAGKLLIAELELGKHLTGTLSWKPKPSAEPIRVPFWTAAWASDQPECM